MTNTQSRPAPALEEHAADQVVERILFATDGGEAGIGAMKWIARRAKLHRMDVSVLTVVEQGWVSTEPTGSAYAEAAERAVASAEAYLARNAPSAEVTTRVGGGEARQAFAEASEGEDLVVVGTSRTGRLSALLGATFPMKLVEAARCPAVVVPRTWKAGHGAVVVGIQGDGSDEDALAFAVREARIMHRELRVVHAWSVPSILGPGGSLTDDELNLADSHDLILNRALAELRSAHPQLTIRGVLAEGEPAEALTREAAGEEMLVVGSHGWSVMDRFFVGSVSREILTRPVCPVAVVRPRRRTEPAA